MSRRKRLRIVRLIQLFVIVIFSAPIVVHVLELKDQYWWARLDWWYVALVVVFPLAMVAIYWVAPKRKIVRSTGRVEKRTG